MADKKNEVYLSKAGSVFGPFDQAEIEKLKASGTLLDYHWMWSAAKNAWEPVDPCPLEIPQSLMKKRSAKKILDYKLEGACHDFRAFVSGTIRNPSPVGCELISTEEDGHPRLSTKRELILNLLNTETGHCVNVRAELRSVNKSDKEWIYQIKWSQMPEVA